MTNNKNAPVIIIGMHRSGTTFLTDMLMKLGMFVGHKFGVNKEDFFFQQRNEWLLRRSGGGWDNPNHIHSLLKNDNYSEEVVKMLTADVNGLSFRHHIKVIKQGLVWGWKDPRTIFTLPIWLHLFPDARLLYIKRNGVDVAGSLHARATRSGVLHGLQPQPVKLKIGNFFSRYERYIYESIRCTDLTESFKLWEEYTLEAENLYEKFSGPKLDVRYEDFLEDPTRYLDAISKFVRLPNEKVRIQELVGDVDSRRRLAFCSKRHLVSLYHEVRDSSLMKSLGYDDIDVDRA